MPATLHNIVGFVGPPSLAPELVCPDSLPRSRNGRGARVEARGRLRGVRRERRSCPTKRTTKTPDDKAPAPGSEYSPMPIPCTDKTDKTIRDRLDSRDAEIWLKGIASIETSRKEGR
jgi:hypothetical protein